MCAAPTDLPQREAAAAKLDGPVDIPGVDKGQLLEDCKSALYAAKICSYAQGMNLIKAMSAEKEWGVDLGECARIWKGCVRLLSWQWPSISTLFLSISSVSTQWNFSLSQPLLVSFLCSLRSFRCVCVCVCVCGVVFIGINLSCFCFFFFFFFFPVCRGCIIRAAFLDRIKSAYLKNPDLPSLLVDPNFAADLNARNIAWRRVVTLAIASGIPVRHETNL